MSHHSPGVDPDAVSVLKFSMLAPVILLKIDEHGTPITNHSGCALKYEVLTGPSASSSKKWHDDPVDEFIFMA
jgi:hypothetical protein